MTSRQYDPGALQRGKFLPVESAMPGTTLQMIPMEVGGQGWGGEGGELSGSCVWGPRCR